MPADVAAFASVCPASASDAGVICRPADTAQVSALLRLCSERGWRVVVRGSGSKSAWGGEPEAVDVVLDTTGLDRVLEHAAGDLVVSAQAGVRWSALQEAVGVARQQLALDSAYPDATLGGIVATSASGPRRLLYGGPRDLLIGVTAVLADGTIARSGGKVVKNVAGYDLGKLYTGSYGTLGVLTELTFRLHPVPAAVSFVSTRCGRAADVQDAVARVRGAQLVASAIEVERDRDGYTLTVLLEGIDAGVAARTEECARLLGGQAVRQPPASWGRLPVVEGGVLLKVVAEPAAVGVVLDAVERALGFADPHYALRGSAGVDVLYAGASAAVGADAIARLREELSAYDGSVVVLEAPAGLRAAADVWGPVAALPLMRRIKHEFDPGRVLAPGRFVGGIR